MAHHTYSCIGTSGKNCQNHHEGVLVKTTAESIWLDALCMLKMMSSIINKARYITIWNKGSLEINKPISHVRTMKKCQPHGAIQTTVCVWWCPQDERPLHDNAHISLSPSKKLLFYFVFRSWLNFIDSNFKVLKSKQLTKI